MFTDTLAKFSFRAVLSAAATLLICLVAVHLLGKLLRRLLARTKLDERIQKYLLAGVKLILYIVTVLIVAESLNIPTRSAERSCIFTLTPRIHRRNCMRRWDFRPLTSSMNISAPISRN